MHLTMMQEHPITPPLELIREWALNHDYTYANELWDYIATQAARWGADQELEACRQWLDNDDFQELGQELYAARRPKSLSKKERALDSLLKCYAFIDDDLYNEIKEAIQSLPDEQ